MNWIVYGVQERCWWSLWVILSSFWKWCTNPIWPFLELYLMKLKKKKKHPFLSENFILTETQNSKSIRNKQTSNKMKITSWWALFHQQPIKDYSYTNIHVTKASASIKKKKMVLANLMIVELVWEMGKESCSKEMRSNRRRFVGTRICCFADISREWECGESHNSYCIEQPRKENITQWVKNNMLTTANQYIIKNTRDWSVIFSQ